MRTRKRNVTPVSIYYKKVKKIITIINHSTVGELIIIKTTHF